MLVCAATATATYNYTEPVGSVFLYCALALHLSVSLAKPGKILSFIHYHSVRVLPKSLSLPPSPSSSCTDTDDNFVSSRLVLVHCLVYIIIVTVEQTLAPIIVLNSGHHVYQQKAGDKKSRCTFNRLFHST